MVPNRRIFALALLALPVAAWAGPAKRVLVDPFPLRFPLAAAGSLEIDGHVVGQPRVRDGILYFGTREGVLTAVVARSRDILWRFETGSRIVSSPEAGGSHVIVCDGAGTFYVLDGRGRLALKMTPAGGASSSVREDDRLICYGDAGGRIVALDAAAGGQVVWQAETSAAVTAGPVFVEGKIVFGTADGRVLAFDRGGRRVWEFEAGSGISADPAAADGRLFLGTSARELFCLSASTGKRLWSRTLQGVPLHPAVIADGIVAIAASNSVVYRLSAKGGSILSWEAVPSRIVYELAGAGPLVLISSASPTLTALDLPSGKRPGQYDASGVLVAGAVWSPLYIILFEEVPGSGRQRAVFLRSH